MTHEFRGQLASYLNMKCYNGIRGVIIAQSAYKNIRLFDSVKTLTHSRVKTDLGTPVVNNKLSAHKHVFILSGCDLQHGTITTAITSTTSLMGSFCMRRFNIPG